MTVPASKFFNDVWSSADGVNWTLTCCNATLIHQSIRNKEIRAQKHQERLWEIEDLKDRFSISD